VTVRQQLVHVGVPHVLELVPGLGSLGGAPEGRDHLLARAVGAGQEQLLLGAEEPEQVGLRDAGLAGDDLGRGPVEAALGEVLDRHREDLLTALVGGLAAGRGAHQPIG
jgi:hypothetical protein